MMSKVFAYLDHIFRMVRPRRLLYMAIDGVAPRAKMNQQRSRRFRSALEAEKLKAEAAAKGEPEAEGEPFDSNCITPGTPFMQRLSAHLKFYVQKKQTEDPLWQKATVILSGHEVRGEGEHKIMEHIRWARGEPGWDSNQTHCLYGLDADLIMLALVTHEPHFCLLREVVKFGAGSNSGQPSRETLTNPTDDGFLLLHVGLLREYLDAEFKSIAPDLPFRYDCERVVDDFVLLSMLVGEYLFPNNHIPPTDCPYKTDTFLFLQSGNDFLPPLPTLDIGEGALNVLFSTYRELLPTLGGYVSGDDGGGTFNPQRLEKILDVMGEMEAKVLSDRAGDAAANEERQQRKSSGGRGFGGGGGGGKPPGSAPKDDRFKKAMAALANGAGVDDAVAAAKLKPDEPLQATTLKEHSDGIEHDPTMMSAAKREMFEEGGAGVEGWKEMYYREKLGLKVGQPPPLAELRQAYFEGLSWVLQYYYRGVASWTWFYPFHYAPMASDLAKGLGALTAQFAYGVPFRPFEQLLAVQPPQSAALLPEPFRWLMSAPHSPLAPFFPAELKVDFEGKRNDWEGVVLLPFLDEDLLKSCINSVPLSKLTDGQGTCWGFPKSNTTV
jgi:5'-3' exoribonuclease 1